MQKCRVHGCDKKAENSALSPSGNPGPPKDSGGLQSVHHSLRIPARVT